MFIFTAMVYVPNNYRIWHYAFYISPCFRILDFVFGMYLYKVARAATFKASYILASVLEVFVLLFLGVCFWYANVKVEVLQPFVFSIYLWVPLSLVIITFYFERGFISKKILSTKLMCSLGGLSFSFYMIHQLVLRYAELANDTYFNYTPGVAYYTTSFFTTLALAYLSHTYFEGIFVNSKIKVIKNSILGA